MELTPYKGSAWHNCAKCKNFTAVSWQIHTGGFNYLYYCDGHQPRHIPEKPKTATKKKAEPKNPKPPSIVVRQRILTLLRGNPCTTKDVADQFYGGKINSALNILQAMLDDGLVIRKPYFSRNHLYAITDEAELLDVAVEARRKQTRLNTPEVKVTGFEFNPPSKLLTPRFGGASQRREAVVKLVREKRQATFEELYEVAGGNKKGLGNLLNRMLSEERPEIAKVSPRNGVNPVYITPGDTEALAQVENSIKLARRSYIPPHTRPILSYLTGNPSTMAEVVAACDASTNDGDLHRVSVVLNRLSKAGAIIKDRLVSPHSPYVYAVSGEERLLKAKLDQMERERRQCS